METKGRRRVVMDYVDSYYRSTMSPRAALDADLDAEVCVVGGGLAGLATALGLRERFARGGRWR